MVRKQGSHMAQIAVFTETVDGIWNSQNHAGPQIDILSLLDGKFMYLDRSVQYDRDSKFQIFDSFAEIVRHLECEYVWSVPA